MRHLVTLSALALLASPATAQQPPTPMARYVIVVLRTPPQSAPPDSVTLARIRTGHMGNIRAMGAAGKLLTAGPIGGAEGIEGIFVFAPEVLKEEIQTWLARDPAIAEGYLVPEFWEWFSPAGLKVVPSGG